MKRTQLGPGSTSRRNDRPGSLLVRGATGLQINHRTARVKKTQLGPGPTHVELAWENCCEGETDRPADQSETGAVRERRSPTKSSQDGVREAATQPRDGCAAGMRKGRGAGRTPTEVFRITNRHRRSKAQPLNRLTQRNGVCPSGETIGRARLNPFGLTPGRLFGERGSILCSRSRIRWTGILQVSRHETLEKARKCSNYRPNNRANGRLSRGFRANATHIARAELAPISLRGSSHVAAPGRSLVAPQSAGEDAAQPTPQQRPAPLPCSPSPAPARAAAL